MEEVDGDLLLLRFIISLHGVSGKRRTRNLFFSVFQRKEMFEMYKIKGPVCVRLAFPGQIRVVKII